MQPLLHNRVIAGVIVGVLALFGIWAVTSLFENVDGDEIVVIQSPVDGRLDVYSEPGVKWQGFGTVTTYKRRGIYEFDCKEQKVDRIIKNDKGQDVKVTVSSWTGGIDIRFNDGGHGTICGSIQYEFPTDPETVRKVYTRYKDPKTIQKQLVEKMVDSAIYLAGQLMSSKESYNETRNDLIHYISDQVQNGVYRTRTKITLAPDPLTNQLKQISVGEIVLDTDGTPKRQEASAVHEFGLKVFNFTISRLPYDEQVEAQIRQQQQLTMDVQTSAAELKKAEQRNLTAEQQGKANATEAKWAQEALKATAVTLAEQEKQVQELNANRDKNVAVTNAEKDRQVADIKKQAAEFTKQEQILLGEGDATRRTLVMNADGALEIKIAAYKYAVDKYSDAIAKYPGNWVPQIVIGGHDAANPGSGAFTMMDVLNIQALKSLGLDIGIKPNAVVQPPVQQPKPAAKIQ